MHFGCDLYKKEDVKVYSVNPILRKCLEPTSKYYCTIVYFKLKQKKKLKYTCSTFKIFCFTPIIINQLYNYLFNVRLRLDSQGPCLPISLLNSQALPHAVIVAAKKSTSLNTYLCIKQLLSYCMLGPLPGCVDSIMDEIDIILFSHGQHKIKQTFLQ